MSLLRPLRPLRALRSPRLLAAYSSATTLPTPSKPAGSHQPDGSTRRELQQSPNVPTTWSRGQMPKPLAYDSPHFEQTDLDLQPNAPSAMGMVAEDPVRLVHGRKAVCEGGMGALGHPKIYINLDQPGPKACGYCGIRYEQAHHDH